MRVIQKVANLHRLPTFAFAPKAHLTKTCGIKRCGKEVAVSSASHRTGIRPAPLDRRRINDEAKLFLNFTKSTRDWCFITFPATARKIPHAG